MPTISYTHMPPCGQRGVSSHPKNPCHLISKFPLAAQQTSEIAKSFIAKDTRAIQLPSQLGMSGQANTLNKQPPFLPLNTNS